MLFTNGSHMAPAAFAREFREAGLPVEDDQVLTPLCSVQGYLERLGGEARVLPFVMEPARRYLEEAGMRLVDGADGARVDAVFVAHADHTDFEELERAARAVIAGARLLTGSYVPAYAGADGPVLSRGAMITAAIAKASGARPVVVGKPSRAAVRAIARRLGVATEETAVVGDDIRLDISLGHLGGSRTVLVRTRDQRDDRPPDDPREATPPPRCRERGRAARPALAEVGCAEARPASSAALASVMRGSTPSMTSISRAACSSSTRRAAWVRLPSSSRSSSGRPITPAISPDSHSAWPASFAACMLSIATAASPFMNTERSSFSVAASPG